MILFGALNKNRTIILPNVNVPCFLNLRLHDEITGRKGKILLLDEIFFENGCSDASILIATIIKVFNHNYLVKELIQDFDLKRLFRGYFNFEILIADVNKNILHYDKHEFIYVPQNCAKWFERFKSTQSSGDISPMISVERFLIFATGKNPISYKGKKIFLSGCGTGGEALICHLLGAELVVGHDSNEDVISFATKRFGSIRGIKFTSNRDDVPKGSFDCVISRHVLEHVKGSWISYLSELKSMISGGGEILLDFPNQNNPREPHTELLFYHLLSKKTRKEIYDYCEAVNPPYYQNNKSKLQSILNHNNIDYALFQSCIPFGLRISHSEFIDFSNSHYNGQNADLIRVVLKNGWSFKLFIRRIMAVLGMSKLLNTTLNILRSQTLHD